MTEVEVLCLRELPEDMDFLSKTFFETQPDLMLTGHCTVPNTNILSSP